MSVIISEGPLFGAGAWGGADTGRWKITGMNNSAEGQKPRVLVVDDEPNITDLVAMALRYEGFEVQGADNGRRALDAVLKFRPHLIVLDVMLPDLDGFEIQSRLSNEAARIPILFLTARDATEDKVRGLSMGADDYVTKPFSIEELIARVRAVLRRSGAQMRSGKLAFADLELDEETHEVHRGGEPNSPRIPKPERPDRQWGTLQ